MDRNWKCLRLSHSIHWYFGSKAFACIFSDSALNYCSCSYLACCIRRPCWITVEQNVWICTLSILKMDQITNIYAIANQQQFWSYFPFQSEIFWLFVCFYWFRFFLFCFCVLFMCVCMCDLLCCVGVLLLFLLFPFQLHVLTINRLISVPTRNFVHYLVILSLFCSKFTLIN